MRSKLLVSASRFAILSVVLGSSTAMAVAQSASDNRWGPRGEIGGYAGDSALTRGEVGLFFPFYQEGDRLFFGDIRGRFFDGGANEGNAAIGFRQHVGNRVYGAWVGYDGRTSAFDNYFDQISGGIEVLNPDWEFRLNGYLPLTDSKTISSTTTSTGAPGSAPSLALIGSQLFLTSGGFTMTTTNRELAMYGLDAEFGVRVPLSSGVDVARASTRGGLPKHDLRLYGGAFYFDHEDFAGEIAGIRARAEWRINDILPNLPGSFAAFEAGYQYDDVRDGEFQAGVRLNVPLGNRRSAVAPDQYDPLMTGFVQRDPNIVTQTATRTTTTAGAREAVNDAATGIALDRTLFVNPGDSLQAAIDGAGQNSHLVVNGGAAYDGSFTVPDNFTLQGSGSVLNVVGRTSGTLATFTAPGSIPTLQNTALGTSDPILGIGSNTHVLAFNIAGPGATGAAPSAYALGAPGTEGIEGRNNIRNVVIEQTSIRDVTGSGIDLTGGGDNILIQNVLIDRSGVDGVSLGLNNSTVTLNNVAIQDSFNNGVRIIGTPGDASTLSFNNVFIGGSQGTGIDILNGGGTFTFANTDIVGSGNRGISLRGGTATMTFDAASFIGHASDGAAVNIDGTGSPNTGSLTFDGTIDTTAGLGLQFNNADGTYDFRGQVTLNGGDAGIDILGDSAGTFTFANTDITNPTGVGLNIANSNAAVDFGSGSSINQANNSSAVSIINHAGGTLTFDGAIGATNGDGLQFSDAAGTYDFNGPVTLNGGDAGVDILNATGAAIEFTDISITNPTGTAVNLAGIQGSAISLTGPITQNSAGTAVNIDGFTDSVIAFQDPITANTGAADGVNLNNFTGSSIVFDGLDIDTTTGTGFTATNFDDSTLTVGASTIDATNGQAIEVNGATNTDVAMLLTSVSSANSAGAGIAFNNVGTANIVAQTVTVDNAAGAGIDIVDSSGTFTFDSLSITDPGTVGLNVMGSDPTVTVNGGTFNIASNATTVGVTNHTGALNFGANINATNGDGLQFNNADGTYNFTGTTTLNGGDAGIDILGGSAGTFTFASTTTITNPTGEAVNIVDFGAGGTFTYNGSITNNNDVIYSVDTTAAGSEINFLTNGANSLTSTDNPNGAVFIFDADGNINQTTEMTVVRPGFSSIFATDGDGTWTFNDLTIIDQIGLNGGVDVFGQQGTVNFHNVNITTNSAGTGDAATGFLAGGNNVMNVTGNSNINANGGGALVLINIDQANMTFGNLTSTNNLTSQIGFAGDDGIDILSVASGTINVTGTTTINNNDGVGISVEDSGVTATFANVAISNVGQDGLITGVAFDNPGIVNINGGSITNTGGDGIRAGSGSFGSGAAGVNVNGVTFSGNAGSTVNLSNSTLSGSGNVAGAFSCTDLGGNTGSISFNGGADSCP